MEEIWDLSKKVDFNNLIYHFKSTTAPKIFSIYERSTKILLKEGNTTLESQKKKKKEIRKKSKN